MIHLINCFERLRREKRKALSLFVTAGLPAIDETATLVVSLAEAGADIIELGIPFSDPIADGPTIQASSDIARAKGVTLETTFGIAEEIRKRSDVPLIMMGYANPILRHGLDRFLTRCASIGVDGTIIADIPLEESAEYRRLTRKHGIAGIFLAAPTTSDERLRHLGSLTRGFLYCVSITGVTGVRKDVSTEAAAFLVRARRFVTTMPILAGFGISNATDAVQIARHCDGIIIGSALIKILLENKDGDGSRNAMMYTREIRKALDEAANE